MEIRLLFATPDSESLFLLNSLLERTQALTCFGVQTAAVTTREDLLARVDASEDDVILLDWPMAGSRTPGLVQEILERNPQARVVALLPMNYRQYRQQLWDAGACNSIPKEYMDQEWLSSILCVMHRAMAREAKLRAQYEGRPYVADATKCRLSRSPVSADEFDERQVGSQQIERR
jgi:CheY-like chemotaxis protein